MNSETGATVAADAVGGQQDANGPATDHQVRPGALTVEQLARLLTAAGGRTTADAKIRWHIDAGAPTLAGGLLKLAHYMARLVREVADGKE